MPYKILNSNTYIFGDIVFIHILIFQSTKILKMLLFLCTFQPGILSSFMVIQSL